MFAPDSFISFFFVVATAGIPCIPCHQHFVILVCDDDEIGSGD